MWSLGYWRQELQVLSHHTRQKDAIGLSVVWDSLYKMSTSQRISLTWVWCFQSEDMQCETNPRVAVKWLEQPRFLLCRTNFDKTRGAQWDNWWLQVIQKFSKHTQCFCTSSGWHQGFEQLCMLVVLGQQCHVLVIFWLVIIIADKTKSVTCTLLHCTSVLCVFPFPYTKGWSYNTSHQNTKNPHICLSSTMCPQVQLIHSWQRFSSHQEASKLGATPTHHSPDMGLCITWDVVVNQTELLCAGSAAIVWRDICALHSKPCMFDVLQCCSLGSSSGSAGWRYNHSACKHTI